MINEEYPHRVLSNNCRENVLTTKKVWLEEQGVNRDDYTFVLYPHFNGVTEQNPSRYNTYWMFKLEKDAIMFRLRYGQ